MPESANGNWHSIQADEELSSSKWQNYQSQNRIWAHVPAGCVCVWERERGVAPGLDVEIAGGIVSLLHPSPLDLG